LETDTERALRYRNLAHEIRTRANAATSDETREMFVKLARDYDKMANYRARTSVSHAQFG
jgi:hypothetical protein